MCVWLQLTSAVAYPGLGAYEQAGSVSAEASSATWSYSEAVALPQLQASLPADPECSVDVLMVVTSKLMVITLIILSVVMTYLL